LPPIQYFFNQSFLFYRSQSAATRINYLSFCCNSCCESGEKDNNERFS